MKKIIYILVIFLTFGTVGAATTLTYQVGNTIIGGQNDIITGTGTSGGDSVQILIDSIVEATGVGTVVLNSNNLNTGVYNVVVKDISDSTSQTNTLIVRTVPSGVVAFVVLNFSNTQSARTNSMFQQFITTNSAIYTAFEAGNLNNTVFFDSNGVIHNAWLEGGNSNTALTSNWFIKLTNSILANSNSNSVIYMGFYSLSTNFDSSNTGELASLSPQYNKYDNGNFVFNMYDSFPCCVINSQWARFGAPIVNNGMLFGNAPTTNDIRSFSAPNVINRTVDWSWNVVVATSSFLGGGLAPSFQTFTTNKNSLKIESGLSLSQTSNFAASNGLAQFVSANVFPSTGNYIFSVWTNSPIDSFGSYYIPGKENSQSINVITTDAYNWFAQPANIILINDATNLATNNAVSINWMRYKEQPPFNIYPSTSFSSLDQPNTNFATIVYNNGNSITYGKSDTITATCTPSTDNCAIQYGATQLANAIGSVTYNAGLLGVANYVMFANDLTTFDNSASNTLVVAQASAIITLPNFPSTHIYNGLSDTLTANIQTINNQVAANDYVNGVLIGAFTTQNTIMESAVGSYTLVANSFSTANYLSNSISKTYSINPAISVIILPANAVAYTPINITNSQSVQTNTTLQYILTVNSLRYKSYEELNLNNTRFSYANGTIIKDFIEINNTNTSIATRYWLKLTNTIGGGNTVTIYMDFYSFSTNFDGINSGEAANLSSTYGNYDNGFSVFNFYDNFLSDAGATIKGKGHINTAYWSVPGTNTDGNYLARNSLTLVGTANVGVQGIKSVQTFNVVNTSVQWFWTVPSPTLASNFVRAGYIQSAASTPSTDMGNLIIINVTSTSANVNTATATAGGVPKYTIYGNVPQSGNTIEGLFSNTVVDWSSNSLYGGENSMSYYPLSTNVFLSGYGTPNVQNARIDFFNNVNGQSGANVVIYWVRDLFTPPFNIYPSASFVSTVTNSPVITSITTTNSLYIYPGFYEISTATWTATATPYNVIWTVTNAIGTVCTTQTYNNIVTTTNTFKYQLTSACGATSNQISKITISAQVIDGQSTQIQTTNTVSVPIPKITTPKIPQFTMYCDVGQSCPVNVTFTDYGFNPKQNDRGGSSLPFNMLVANNIQPIRIGLDGTVATKTNVTAEVANGIPVIGIVSFIYNASNSQWCKNLGNPLAGCKWTQSQWNATIPLLVGNYPSVHDWECINEPNLNWNVANYWNGNFVHYAQLCRALSVEIKSSAGHFNDTIICGGGLPLTNAAGRNFVNYSTNFWNYSMARYCDVTSLHGYTNSGQLLNNTGTNGNSNPPFAVNTIAANWTHVIGLYANLTHRPIWITETGMSLAQSTVNRVYEINATLYNMTLQVNPQTTTQIDWFYSLINTTGVPDPTWNNLLFWNASRGVAPRTFKFNFIYANNNVLQSSITSTSVSWIANTVNLKPTTAMVGQTFYANAVITDNEVTPVVVNTISSGNIVINSAFTSNILTFSKTSFTYNQVEVITMNVSGGTSPYYYNFTLTNSTNGNIIEYFNSTVTTASNSFSFVISSAAVNTTGILNFNGTILDNATHQNKLRQSGTITFVTTGSTPGGNSGGGGSIGVSTTTTILPSNIPINLPQGTPILSLQNVIIALSLFMVIIFFGRGFRKR